MGTGMKRIVFPPLRVGVPFLKSLPSRSVTRPPLYQEARWLCVHPSHNRVALLAALLGDAQHFIYRLMTAKQEAVKGYCSK